MLFQEQIAETRADAKRTDRKRLVRDDVMAACPGLWQRVWADRRKWICTKKNVWEMISVGSFWYENCWVFRLMHWRLPRCRTPSVISSCLGSRDSQTGLASRRDTLLVTTVSWIFMWDILNVLPLALIRGLPEEQAFNLAVEVLFQRPTSCIRYLSLIPFPASDSSFLLLQTVGSSSNGSNSCVLAIHMKNWHSVPNSWLYLQPIPRHCRHWKGTNQQLGAFTSLSMNLK